MSATTTSAVNAAVKAAQTLGELKTNLETASPALAAALETKPLIASKTPWGTLLTGVVAYLAAKYGLPFDQTTDALIGGAGVLVGSYAMRAITASPIAGWFMTPRAAP